MASLCVQTQRQNKTVQTCISENSGMFSCQSWTWIWPKFLWLSVKKKANEIDWSFSPKMGLEGGERGRKEIKTDIFSLQNLKVLYKLTFKWSLRFPGLDKGPDWKKRNTFYPPPIPRSIPHKTFGLYFPLPEADTAQMLSLSKLHCAAWYPLRKYYTSL